MQIYTQKVMVSAQHELNVQRSTGYAQLQRALLTQISP